MPPQDSAVHLAKQTFTVTGEVSNDGVKVPLLAAEIGEGRACQPMLSECPLGCGHAHVEHPHLNMMHE
jgi:hypothetical protein